MCKLVEHLQRFIHSSFAHILCLMEFWGYQVWTSDKTESLHINQQRHESSVLESRRSKLPSVVLRRPDPADLQQGLPVQQRTTHSQIHAYLLPLWPRSWSWTTWFPGKPFVYTFGHFLYGLLRPSPVKSLHLQTLIFYESRLRTNTPITSAGIHPTHVLKGLMSVWWQIPTLLTSTTYPGNAWIAAKMGFGFF